MILFETGNYRHILGCCSSSPSPAEAGKVAGFNPSTEEPRSHPHPIAHSHGGDQEQEALDVMPWGGSGQTPLCYGVPAMLWVLGSHSGSAPGSYLFIYQ